MSKMLFGAMLVIWCVIALTIPLSFVTFIWIGDVLFIKIALTALVLAATCGMAVGIFDDFDD